MLESINPIYAIILALLIALLRYPAQSDSRMSSLPALSPSTALAGNILLLTAHPDDECMFFAPTILALAAPQQPSGSNEPLKSSLYSMCLSFGNADGLGAIREYELENSLDIMGVDSTKRTIVDHPWVPLPEILGRVFDRIPQRSAR